MPLHIVMHSIRFITMLNLCIDHRFGTLPENTGTAESVSGEIGRLGKCCIESCECGIEGNEAHKNHFKFCRRACTGKELVGHQGK